MGAPVAGRTLRRGLATLVGCSTVFGVLVSAASPAHAFTLCDSSSLPCITAVPDTYTTPFNTKLTVTAANGVLNNDSGGPGTQVDVADSDSISFNGAKVNLNPDGSFTYVPDPTNPYSGIDTFDYAIKESNGDSDFTTVTVNVTAIVNDDLYSMQANTTLTVPAPGVFANDAGIDPLSLAFDPTSANGVTIFDDGSGAFDYTPPHGFVGNDTFNYKVDDIDGDFTYTKTVTIHVNPVGPPPPTKPTGYWMVGAAGSVYAFGQLRFYGSAPTPVATHIEPTPSRLGYWVVDRLGRVYAFGDARPFGRAPSLRAGEFARSLSSTPDGLGYWIFTDHGRVFPRGDAVSHGDLSNVRLNGPIVGSATTTTGNGYYMVGSDGGIFAFGDAHFFGSMGGAHLNRPVNGLVPTADNRGYWLVASDGGIFAFGDARFRGSMGGRPLSRPIIGMVRYGNGYLMVSSDGGIFDFSNLPFVGSLGNHPPSIPIVSVASGG
jgi:hypothetical protein